nr:MAG TPA_asm: hypothetical protein [Caudoviricetes sp.]
MLDLFSSYRVKKLKLYLVKCYSEMLCKGSNFTNRNIRYIFFP